MSRLRPAQNLSFAVVGVGEMGQNHARCLAAMKGVDLVAVVDPDDQRRMSISANYGCEAHASITQLQGIDAAVIAAPTAMHADLGCALLERGIHCLIEKPLAYSREEAQLLIDTADLADTTLQVGHIERFNPAVRQLKELLIGESTIVANASRMSAFSGRVEDIDVVMDLMVHDLDVVLFLLEESTGEVVARGIDGPHGFDHVTVLVSFPSGRLATLTASRITQNLVRKLEITTNDRYFTIDYPNQELLVFQQGRIEGIGNREDKTSYSLDVDTRRVFVRRGEPLIAELEHFVGAIRGHHMNEVDGRQALRALELVWKVQTCLAAWQNHSD